MARRVGGTCQRRRPCSSSCRCSPCGARYSYSCAPDGSEEIWSLRVPYLLSFLSTHTLDGCVEGLNDLQDLYTQRFGAGVDYRPEIWVTYWSFRWMMGFGGAVAVANLVFAPLVEAVGMPPIMIAGAVIAVWLAWYARLDAPERQPSSAAATRSSPATRLPLTSTETPGSSAPQRVLIDRVDVIRVVLRTIENLAELRNRLIQNSKLMH